MNNTTDGTAITTETKMNELDKWSNEDIALELEQRFKRTGSISLTLPSLSKQPEIANITGDVLLQTLSERLINEGADVKSRPSMDKKRLVELLVEDLGNEYGHMHFYLNASCMLQGTVREELGEWMAEEARDEMKHVEQFTKLIVELGGSYMLKDLKTSKPICADLETYAYVDKCLEYIIRMEMNVVERYTQRMEDAMEVGGINGRYVEIFLEDQILDSRGTVAHVRQMLENPSIHTNGKLTQANLV